MRKKIGVIRTYVRRILSLPLIKYENMTIIMGIIYNAKLEESSKLYNEKPLY